MLGGLGHHMPGHLGGSGIENLVKALLQTKIRHIVAAVNDSHIFRREGIRHHPLHQGGAGFGLGAGFNDGGIAAGNAGGQHAEAQQNGKVKGTDNQRDAVGHLIHLCQQTGKAVKTGKMIFRPGPLFQPFDDLIDLQNHRADIAEIGLGFAASQVLHQSRLQLLFIMGHGISQLFQLPDTEIDIQGFPG